MSVWNFLKNVAGGSVNILVKPRLMHKWHILGAYLRMTAKDGLIRRGLLDPPYTEKIGSYKLRYADYRSMLSMWEDIYIRRVYEFDPAKPDPRILDVGSNI